MAYDNNDMKFVAVINRKHSLPVVMNAVAHTALGMRAKTGGVEHFLDYPNQASGFLAKISKYPFIILEAKNGNQLKTLCASAIESADLSYNVFTTSMIASSAEEQIQSTLVADGEGLDFVAVALFGARAAIDPLTKKFSLLKP